MADFSDLLIWIFVWKYYGRIYIQIRKQFRLIKYNFFECKEGHEHNINEHFNS